MRDPAGAIKHYRTVLTLDPKNHAGHSNLGAALRLVKDQAGAVKHFRMALALEPRSAPPTTTSAWP